jgi:hypothetical protein
MATRFISNGLDCEASPYSHVAPFSVESDGVLRLVRGAQFKGACSTDPGAEPVVVNRVVRVATAAAVTLVAADHATVVAFATTSTVTVTLPLAATAGAGWQVTGVVEVLPTSGVGHQFRPASTADTIYVTATAAGSALAISTSSDAIGDAVTLVSDGVSRWYITSARTKDPLVLVPVV